MRPSRDDIIFSALSLIRDNAVPDFGDEETRQTREANFDSAFRRILGRFSWSAFFKKAPLSAREDVPNSEDFQYSYKFHLPDDFSRMFACASSIEEINAVSLSKIWTYGDRYYWNLFGDYEHYGNYIYSNSDTLFLAYQHNDYDKSGPLHPAFISALEFCVAAFLAISVKSDRVLMETYLQLFERECRVAVNDDRLSVRERSSEGDNSFGALL